MPLTPGDRATRLHGGIRFLQMALSPRFRDRAWRTQVRDVIDSLGKLNHSTEAGFLAVGSNLMDFLTSSRRLHSDIGGLTAMVSGEQARHACDALVSVRSYVQDMEQRSAHEGQALLALQASSASIHRGFSTLGKIALSFHVTAMLARIETARLSQGDLGALADEVRSCSTGIQSSAVKVLEAAAAFDSRIAFTLSEASRLGAIQRKELPTLFAAVNSDLEIFEGQQREAAHASSRLSTDLESVTRDLGAIATSIQFHDITRQQIEHVIEALEALLRDAPSGAISPSGAALVRLQLAHLKSATASFVRSAQTIDRDLDGIAHRVQDMATASTSILGLDHGKKDTFLSDIHHRFGGVVQAVSELHAVECSTRAIVCELEAFSESLRASVREVRSIELHLSRISVNAVLSACHLGNPGEPLSVVGSAMQSLQLECAARSRAAEADLDSIGKAILSLGAPSESERASTAQGSTSATILEDLKARMNDLLSSSAASSSAASAVVVLAATLERKLQEARSHSGIGPLFAKRAEHCCGELERAAANARPLWFFPEPVAAPAVEDRYTMQTERDVHQIVTSGAAPPSAETAPTPAPAECGEVEFF